MHQPIASLNLAQFKVKELKSVGYQFCKDANTADKKFVSRIQDWDALNSSSKTKTALDVYQEECIPGAILTPSKELDEALGGGIPLGLITELCGESGCGKTQVCLHMCVNVQLPIWCGGLAGHSIYISTNKGFASHRLKEIANAYVNNYEDFKQNNHSMLKGDDQFNVESIMKNIHYLDICDLIEVIAAVNYVENLIQDNPTIRLVIIDSISAPLRQAQFIERTQILYRLCSDLQTLAQKFKFAIVFTNDMTTRIVNNLTCHAPSLGGSYYHRINIRIQLSKKSDTVFQASVIKNILKSSSTVEFSLFT